MNAVRHRPGMPAQRPYRTKRMYRMIRTRRDHTSSSRFTEPAVPCMRSIASRPPSYLVPRSSLSATGVPLSSCRSVTSTPIRPSWPIIGVTFTVGLRYTSHQIAKQCTHREIFTCTPRAGVRCSRGPHHRSTIHRENRPAEVQRPARVFISISMSHPAKATTPACGVGMRARWRRPRAYLLFTTKPRSH